MKRSLKAAALIAVLIGFLSAQTTAPKQSVDKLGPYTLGTPYDDIKTLPGFVLDAARTKPEENVVAGKIIDDAVYNTRTLRRFIFKQGRLMRVSIIFLTPQQWTEERVKQVVAEQWGDPGPKVSIDSARGYAWSGSKGFIMILPADGGRWMASCMANDWQQR